MKKRTQFNAGKIVEHPRFAIKHNRTLMLLVVLILLVSSCADRELTKRQQQKVANKTFVILGASSGFGRGIAEQLGKYKANVVLAARRTELLNDVADIVRQSGGQALVVTTDISDASQVEKLGEAAIDEFGKIDVWINMAGVGAIGPFWEIPIEEQARLVDINLKGFIYGSHVALNQFRAQGFGRLINMGSVESFNPLAYHASYAATKGGVLNLGQALNQELRLNGHKNIRVITVEPWAVDTPFWGHAANYSGGTPRMAAMDGPSKVVHTTIRAALKNKHELPVGGKAKANWVFHRIFPRTTERLSARIVHKYQMEDAPPAADTDGALYKPVSSGRGVDDGVRKRMKRERKMRKNGEEMSSASNRNEN